MQQIVFDQLGRLPPQFFRVMYSAPLESLAELMKLSMHWGYALRNAHGAVEDLDRMLQAGKAEEICDILHLVRCTCLQACCMAVTSYNLVYMYTDSVETDIRQAQQAQFMYTDCVAQRQLLDSYTDLAKPLSLTSMRNGMR